MAIWMEVNVGKYNAGSVKAGGSWVQTPLGGKRVFFPPPSSSPKCPDWLWDPHRLLFNGY